MIHTDRVAMIVRIADEIWNRGDLAVVDEVMAPDAKYLDLLGMW